MSAESPNREDEVKEIEEKTTIEQQENNDESRPPITDEEQDKRSPRSQSNSPPRNVEEDSHQLSTSNEDKTDEPPRINEREEREERNENDERQDSNGGSSRRSYDNNRYPPGNNYPPRDNRPYGRGGGYRGDYYDNQRGPIISDHRNPNYRREYNNYPSGGRGYPSTKRDYGSIRPDDSYDPATKRMRRSPERDFRYDRGGAIGAPYDQRRPPYPRRNSPPLGPPQRYEPNYRGYGQAPPRYERPYEQSAPFPRSRTPPPPQVYERGTYEPRRGGYPSRYPERRPMINEERAVASGFDTYNRGPSYRGGPPEERYPREAPIVIDRRNTERYNQPPPSYTAPYDNRRRGSFEEQRRTGGGQPYYTETTTNPTSYSSTSNTNSEHPSYHQRETYTQGRSGYNNSGYEYSENNHSSSSGSQYRDSYEKSQPATTTTASSSTVLPPNWLEYQTKDGKKYYYHSIEKKSQWEVPK